MESTNTNPSDSNKSKFCVGIYETGPERVHFEFRTKTVDSVPNIKAEISRVLFERGYILTPENMGVAINGRDLTDELANNAKYPRYVIYPNYPPSGINNEPR